MDEHLSSNSLYLPLHSACRKVHSTETVFLAMHNNIITAMDRGKITALMLLHLLALFDAVDHTLLFNTSSRLSRALVRNHYCSAKMV